MEPEGSLPRSQELFTCKYPEPDQSSPQHSILSLKGPSLRAGIPVRIRLVFRYIAVGIPSLYTLPSHKTYSSTATYVHVLKLLQVSLDLHEQYNGPPLCSSG
jgi:hypothetical protein